MYGINGTKHSRSNCLHGPSNAHASCLHDQPNHLHPATQPGTVQHPLTQRPPSPGKQPNYKTRTCTGRPPSEASKAYTSLGLLGSVKE